MNPKMSALYRYPFKGMSAEPLQSIRLTPGETIPLDRRFALAHGTTEFSPQHPQHLPKTKFLMLMKNEALAALKTTYDDNSGVFSVHHQGVLKASGDLNSLEGRCNIEAFLQDYLGDEVQGQARIVEAPGHSFSDVPNKVLSFINLASVRAFEQVLGTTLDPLRFRANVYIEGVPAWAEFEWQHLHIGDVVFKALKPTARCAATNVNPQTAQRDQTLPQMLYKTYGHRNMGMYMSVEQGGELAVDMSF